MLDLGGQGSNICQPRTAATALPARRPLEGRTERVKENLETCSRKEIDSLFISETLEHGDPRGSHAGTEPVGLLPPYPVWLFSVGLMEPVLSMSNRC